MRVEPPSQFWFLRASLRAKVTLGVVLPLVLILGIFTAFEYVRYKDVVLTNLSQLASYSGQVIEDNLRIAMLESDFARIQHLLDTIGEREQFRVVYLLDKSGKVIFAPNKEHIATQLDNRQPDCQPCHRLPPDERPNSVVVKSRDGQWVFRSMRPIENSSECAQCHDPAQRIIGLLLTDISVAPFESALVSALHENLVWWVATILVTVLVANLAVGRFVTRRLKGLSTAIADLGQGQLPPPLPETQPDEIGQLARGFNSMARQIEARDAENRELSESLRRQSSQRGELLKRLITAQEDERKRVARELHDELGQALAGLALQVKILEHYINSDAERTQEQLNQIRSLITQTSDRMYDLIIALRPSALDDLGLVAALRAYADQLLSGSGIIFELDAQGMGQRLPPDLETALYRIIQEALSNISRHAKAKKVHVTLSRTDSTFEGEILDDGKGFVPDTVRTDGQSSRGLGLLGMQERVTQCGGELKIVSRPGSGTRILIRVPLKESCFD